MSVSDNINFFGTFRGLQQEAIDDEKAHLLKKFGIEGKKDTLASDLSGG